MENHIVDETGTEPSSEASRLISPAPHNLRHVVDDIPNRVWIVAFIGLWERFTFWGITAPWQNYMQNHPYENGVLGLGQSMATNIYCAFYIFYYVTPLLFGVISDTRLGRYSTLCLSIVLYFLGCVVLCVSSHPTMSQNWGLAGLAVSMFLIGLGGGGFKAIMAAFIADQYDDRGPIIKTLKSGEQVVTSRTLTLQYIYNLYYWVGNLGSLSWFATVALEKFVSFTSAYILATSSLIIAMLFLFAGRKYFIKAPCEGNILQKATEVLLCACRNKFRMHRADPIYQMEHHGKTVHWSSELVDELIRGLMACRVLIGFIAFYVCFDQMQNNLISQAGQMESHNIPNDIMPAFNQVACIILGPLIQNLLYPFLRKRNIQFRPITRITVGFMFTALAMAYSACIQNLIYTTGPCYNHASDCYDEYFKPTNNRVNVWIQLPVYVIIAAGEIFAYVTALEYAYDHAPKDMKSIVQAISLVVAGLGSACAMALTPAARDPYLVILYVALAGIMVVTTGLFWWMFRKYDDLYWDDGKGGEPVHAEQDQQTRDVERKIGFVSGREIPATDGSVPKRHSREHDHNDDKEVKVGSRPASDATLVETPMKGVGKGVDMVPKSATMGRPETKNSYTGSGSTNSFKSAKSVIETASSYETADTRIREDESTQPRPLSDVTTLRPSSDATLDGKTSISNFENVDI